MTSLAILAQLSMWKHSDKLIPFAIGLFNYERIDGGVFDFLLAQRICCVQMPHPGC
jgi:hypothetical protein